MINSTQLWSVWRRWSGSPQEFSLDTRIFHSVCFITVVALVYNVPLNYIVGLPLIAVASGLTLLLVIGVYYLSRFRYKVSLAKLIFCIAGMFLFTSNFFLNSGINGPTDLFFILTMIMMVSIVPVRQYWVWVSLNIIIVLFLHYLQYIKPELIPNTYLHPQNRFVDITSAYVTVVALSLFNFHFIRHNYEVEKKSSEQKAEIMKVLNEQKNKLFSILSHDLKSPLSHIQSYLEVLVDLDLTAEERLGIEKNLLDSTKSTLELLNNILNWTKSQMDGLTFELSPLNVSGTLSAQLIHLEKIAANKEINLNVTVDPGLEALGNAEMLQLVIRNLVSNAIKFTAKGGHIWVSATSEKKHCIITVKDSGVGQPVNLTQDIFYLNSKPSVGTANEKGIGLGLALCKEYTEAQNGKVSFKCDPVSGTTFYVVLPKADEPPHL